jgi:hypothetical protein
MIFSDSLARIRLFLRDPDGDIWSDNDVLTYFNDAQTEIASKTRILTTVDTSPYPPSYSWSYLYDFEYEYVDGDEYRPLHSHMQSGDIRCFPWEGAFWFETSSTPDDGAEFTQPWESEYLGPSDIIPLPLHRRFERMRFAAFDELPIDSITEKEVMQGDPHYRTRTGEVRFYYIPDEYRNQVVLYPRPSNVQWQNEDHTDSLVDTGGIVYGGDSWFDHEDFGLATEVIDADNALLTVYDFTPKDIGDYDSEPDFPAWAVKYVEFATLERCFGADTDGFIPTLRDYWKSRKEIGIAALNRLTRLALGNRDYRLGGYLDRPARRGRGFSLGAHYPAI